MAALDRPNPDPRPSAEPLQRPKPLAGVAAPSLPHWLAPPPPADTHWEWLDASPVAAGLEVTEHAVPSGWLARTFGIAVDPMADAPLPGQPPGGRPLRR